jgi:hypothetical protein
VRATGIISLTTFHEVRRLSGKPIAGPMVADLGAKLALVIGVKA